MCFASRFVSVVQFNVLGLLGMVVGDALSACRFVFVVQCNCLSINQ